MTQARRTFEQWFDGIFDHPVTEPEWFWDEDADLCIEEDETNVRYLTRLFTNCDSILSRFDNAQVNQGLNLIVSASCSNHAFSIVSGNIPWNVRRDAIRSIYDVYAKCFSPRCTSALGHLGEPANPLTFVCYMWWDIFPAHISSEEKSRAAEADEYLAVMERSLSLSNPACLEGALHGLGHWHLNFPARVEQIIDRFLSENSNLRPDLVKYAHRARSGTVL